MTADSNQDRVHEHPCGRTAGGLAYRLAERIYCAVAKWAEEVRTGRCMPTAISNFALTSRCNLLCQTCNIGRDFLEDPKRSCTDLTTEQILTFLDVNVRYLRFVSWIQFTGGEPFFRSDIEVVVRAFAKRLPRCGIWIPTNGWQPKRIECKVAAICEATRKFGVGVSIHGNRAAHDRFAGVEGSYDRAVETLHRLVSLKTRYPRLRVSISYTAYPENLRYVTETYRYAKEAGAEFTFRLANHSDLYYRDAFATSSWHDHLPELEDQLDRLEYLMGFSNRFISPLKYPRMRYYAGMRDYALEPAKRVLGCSAGRDTLYIRADGSIYPCLFVNEKMGNIGDAPLPEILATPANHALQERIRCGDCPNCWVESEAYHMIAGSGMHTLWFGLRRTLKNWYPATKRSGLRERQSTSNDCG